MSIAFRRQVATGTVPTLSSISGVTGASSVATDPPVTDSLIFDTTAATSPRSTTTLILTPTTSSSDTATASVSGVADASSASKKGSSIPIGTVVGICVGVFAVLCAVLLLALWWGKRQRQRLKRIYAKGRSPVSNTHNDRQNVERRKSGREVWVKMEDKDDDGYEKYAMKRTTTSPSDLGSGVTIERSVTVKSAKSSKTFKSLGYGAGLGLADTFKTPEVPPRLEFTDSEMGTGRALPPFARSEHGSMTSWDGETMADESFLSLKSRSEVNSGEVYRSVGAMSPSMVVTHQTPPATTTDPHTWHEAEVVSPEGAYGGFDDHQRHTVAGASSSSPPSRISEETIRKSTTKPKNPFRDPNPFDDSFGAATHPPPISGESATSAPSTYSQSSALTTRGTFADQQDQLLQPKRNDDKSQRENRAMQSLIAALNISSDDARERISAAQQLTPRQSVRSSVYTDADDASLRSENFPLPPTDIEHHKNS